MNQEDPRAKSFTGFFQAAAGGFTPYDWQTYVALDGLPDVLPVPTGLGKTEVALAWAWRLLVDKQPEPLHLVVCLPMRSLVTQTVQRLKTYFDQEHDLGCHSYRSSWRELARTAVRGAGAPWGHAAVSVTKDLLGRTRMVNQLTCDVLTDAVRGSAAFRSCRSLQPAGGERDKVFSPTFAGAAIEKRRMHGRSDAFQCVLLDSVQSQTGSTSRA